ncbi:peptidase S8 [Bosea caraganae]|uniref:Peptidase S8 n=1 Tax=Bosea caraganae TaxID=2763117 RepID=A0A370LA00_9HYPH|nr:S8 family serine peptidase [Bosea caraganae]RDJ21821.1 peptidase S8 [Bosea caraganae]RDJ28148.1 peptidase S8 [Bosea caraganae]
MSRSLWTMKSRRLAQLAGCAGLALLVALPAFAQSYRDQQGYSQGAAATRQGYGQGSRVERTQTTRPYQGGRDTPGRQGYGGQRYPGRGGGNWGPAAVGVGAGIIGGLIVDQARRQPVYDPYEDEPPRPRRPRRPAVYEYEDEAPAVQRPRRQKVREAAPPRQTPPPGRTQASAPGGPRVIVPPVAERRLVNEEVLFELAPGAELDAVLRRHRATLIESRRFELAGTTIIRARLNDGRSARTALAQMAGDPRIANAQPNYLYTLQQESGPKPEAGAAPVPTLVLSPPKPTEAAPAIAVAPKSEPLPQYIVEKLHLDAVHKIARGTAIKVAVIDSGVDLGSAELQGVVAGSFDALGGAAQPEAHGTAMAAAIMAQAQLQGIAPAARLLAARAFASGGAPGLANGTTFHILASLDWAAGQGARVFNLSFAGPQDRLLSRSLAGAKAKGIVAVAAAGNGGAKAAPLYPGADPSVIAVTATDADDKPFAQANRGDYVALAAPGVDVLAAEPAGRYAFSSGTSIAAAHVSGLVALVLEKRPDLDPDGVRKLLAESAVDLGAKGKDPVFGAGRIDAQAALARALPVSASR